MAVHPTAAILVLSLAASTAQAQPNLYRTPGGYYYDVQPGMPPDHPAYWSPRYRAFPDYDVQLGRRASRLGGASFRRSAGQAFGYGNCAAYGAYGYGGYGSGACGGYNPTAFRDAYDQGRYDSDHDYIAFIAAARAGRLLDQHAQLFDDGVIFFRAGRYDQAAIKFLGAAEKSHISGAARLHAGHALFALARYEEATRLLERAFELSPGLAHKTYDIRDEYGAKSDFAKHLTRLEEFVAAHPQDAGAMTLLGYVLFYSVGPSAAWAPLEQASKLDARSYFIPRLLELARMAHGPAELDAQFGREGSIDQQPTAPQVPSNPRPAEAEPEHPFHPAAGLRLPPAPPPSPQPAAESDDAPADARFQPGEDLRETNRRLASAHAA